MLAQVAGYWAWLAAKFLPTFRLVFDKFEFVASHLSGQFARHCVYVTNYTVRPGIAHHR